MARKVAPHDWTLVVPVRDPRSGKSRLGAGADVARAIAVDTLSPAVACTAVARLILVTDDTEWVAGDWSANPKLELVHQAAPGLTAAITDGVRRAGSLPHPVAIMLGDLPALTAETLERALTAAEGVPLGMVTDADGTGTTLVTALRASEHRPAFGTGSAARHRALRYAELPVSEGSGLRRDVDTADDLREALRLGAGAATRVALERTGVLAS